MTARDAYIVEAVRTPVGRRAGGLSGVHPADLGAHVIRATIDRTGVERQVSVRPERTPG
jgi:acetyl-CoA C-acetyltransferase